MILVPPASNGPIRSGRSGRRYARAVAICALFATTSGCLFSPIAWSPDGRWLAFVTESPAATPMLPLGWWAKPDSTLEPPGHATELDPAQTLWVCQLETRRCWRLARNAHGLSAPAWSGDGRIAYARLVRTADQPNRCEILLQRGFDPPMLLTASSVPATAGAGSLLGEAKRISLATRAMTPAWSPRGSFLAAPWLDPPGTAVIRLSDGSVLAKYPNAYSPSWSPDEATVALAVSGSAAGYYVSGPGFGPLSLAVPTAHAVEEAIWDAHTASFFVVAWREQAKGGPLAPYLAELIRYDVKLARAETVRNLIARRLPADDETAGVFAARIPGTASLLTVAATGRRTSEILEVHLDRLKPARRHTVLDPELFCGAVSFGTDRHRVALRFGPPDSLGVPAVLDLPSGRLETVAPDAATQILAAQSCIDLILRLLETPNPIDPKPRIPNALRLPSPGRLTAFALRDGRLADRIDRLARFALSTLDATPEATPDPVQHQALAESRMFLHYILADYAATLIAADTLEPLLERAHDRHALTLVRAQCYLGQRKWSTARDLLVLLNQKAGKLDAASGQPAEPDPLQSTTRELLEELADAEK